MGQQQPNVAYRAIGRFAPIAVVRFDRDLTMITSADNRFGFTLMLGFRSGVWRTSDATITSDREADEVSK
jgi:hypothetical protein